MVVPLGAVGRLVGGEEKGRFIRVDLHETGVYVRLADDPEMEHECVGEWLADRDEAEEVFARNGWQVDWGTAWLRDARITGVQGIFYRPEGQAGEPEAVEFIVASGRSVVLTCGTDWTLRVEAGSWPSLPVWCVPPVQWEFRDLSQVPLPSDEVGGWDVTGIEERRDEAGQVHESVIHCEGGVFRVIAGDVLVVNFSPAVRRWWYEGDCVLPPALRRRPEALDQPYTQWRVGEARGLLTLLLEDRELPPHIRELNLPTGRMREVWDDIQRELLARIPEDGRFTWADVDAWVCERRGRGEVYGLQERALAQVEAVLLDLVLLLRDEAAGSVFRWLRMAGDPARFAPWVVPLAERCAAAGIGAIEAAALLEEVRERTE
ncbi:hypothetical protein [Streptomyces sp. NPDC050504]|uniref:hypothetical protein n=1 Tax=Streptomyces sp. NPDC050504 TaxID=3365618 RepID=UPI003799EC15